MKRFNKNALQMNRTFILYFMSYLIVIIIPVIFISVFSYRLSVRTLEEELSGANENSLKQISMSVNNVLQVVNTLSIQVGLDRELYAFAKDTKNYFLLNDIKDRLKNIVSNNDKIAAVHIYFEQNRHIVSSDGLTHSYGDSSRDQWVKSIKHSGRDYLWIGTRKYKNVDGNYDRILTLVRKLPVAIPVQLGYLSIDLYESKLADTLKKMENDRHTNLYVVDEKGNVISSYIQQYTIHSADTAGHIKQALTLGKEGYFVDRKNKPFALISYTKSLNNGWTLISETPLTYLLNQLAYIRKLTLITCIFLILLGFVISYILSRSMYNPIKKLMDQSKRYQRELSLSVNNKPKNEFTFLSGLLDKAAVQNRELQKSIQANFPALIERFVIHLLHNRVTGKQEAEEQISFLRLDMTTENYTVLLIEMDEYSSLQESFSSQDMRLFKFAINNIAQEIIQQHYPCLMTEVNPNQNIALINVKGDHDECRKQLIKLAEKLKNTIRQILKLSVTISIGRVYKDITQAYLAYHEAVDVIKYKLIKGKNSIIFYDEFNEGQHINYYYPIQIEKSVTNNLRSGNYEGAEQFMNQLYAEITEMQTFAYENIYRLYNRLLDASVNVLTDLNYTVRDICGEDYFIYRELAKRETIGAIHEWMCGLFKQICGYIAERQQNGTNKTIEQVLTYINTCYDQDISVEMISDHVQLNPSYLSRVFKQEMGKTIIECLALKRHEESKKLLINGNLSIKEIASAVGYNNINSYIRYFKKYEGVTPGVYRQNNEAV